MKNLEDKTLLGPTCHRQTSLKAISNLGLSALPIFQMEQEFEPRSIWLQCLVASHMSYNRNTTEDPRDDLGPSTDTLVLPNLLYRERLAPILTTVSEVKCPFCNLHAKWILATGFYWETDSLFPTPSIRKHIVFFTVVHFAFRGD